MAYLCTMFSIFSWPSSVLCFVMAYILKYSVMFPIFIFHSRYVVLGLLAYLFINKCCWACSLICFSVLGLLAYVLLNLWFWTCSHISFSICCVGLGHIFHFRYVVLGLVTYFILDMSWCWVCQLVRQPNRDFWSNLAREYPQWVFADYASQNLPHQ